MWQARGRAGTVGRTEGWGVRGRGSGPPPSVKLSCAPLADAGAAPSAGWGGQGTSEPSPCLPPLPSFLPPFLSSLAVEQPGPPGSHGQVQHGGADPAGPR